MARFWKDAERKSYQPQGPSPEIAVPASDIRSAQAATSDGERDSAPRDDMRGTSLFLGKGSRVSGKLACRGPGRIDGEVEGEISSQDTLIFGESAIINGQIEGASIVVQGRVTGDITARNRLEIRPPAKVFGKITTPSLVIHDGAIYDGQCTMGGTEMAKDHAAPPFPKDERSEGS